MGFGFGRESSREPRVETISGKFSPHNHINFNFNCLSQRSTNSLRFDSEGSTRPILVDPPFSAGGARIVNARHPSKGGL